MKLLRTLREILLIVVWIAVALGLAFYLWLLFTIATGG